MNLGFHMKLEEGIGGNGLKGQQLETRLPVGSGLWDSGISTLGKSLFFKGSQGLPAARAQLTSISAALM